MPVTKKWGEGGGEIWAGRKQERGGAGVGGGGAGGGGGREEARLGS